MARGEVSSAKSSSQPLSHRIHYCLKEAITRWTFNKFLHSHRHILYTQWARSYAALKKSLGLHKKITEALIEGDTTHIGSIVKKHWSP